MAAGDSVKAAANWAIDQTIFWWNQSIRSTDRLHHWLLSAWEQLIAGRNCFCNEFAWSTRWSFDDLTQLLLIRSRLLWAVQSKRFMAAAYREVCLVSFVWFPLFLMNLISLPLFFKENPSDWCRLHCCNDQYHRLDPAKIIGLLQSEQLAVGSVVLPSHWRLFKEGRQVGASPFSIQ